MVAVRLTSHMTFTIVLNISEVPILEKFIIASIILRLISFIVENTIMVFDKSENYKMTEIGYKCKN